MVRIAHSTYSRCWAQIGVSIFRELDLGANKELGIEFVQNVTRNVGKKFNSLFNHIIRSVTKKVEKNLTGSSLRGKN